MLLPAVRLDVGDLVLSVDEQPLHDGERIVLFGPNGAGKTSYVRAVAGVGPGADDPVAAAYLPQRPYAFRGSGAANLLMGLAPARHATAQALAAELGIADVLLRPARALSGGERHRLALARVLARPEPLVLLDEPLAPLDVRDRAAVARVIARAIGHRAAVIVSHDREEAAILGGTLAVMVDGSIRQRGPVTEVFALPDDDDIAAIVGVGNVLRGEVNRTRGALVELAVGDQTLWGMGDAASGPATALFGAEAVTVYAGSVTGGSARNVWSGRVMATRETGRLVELVVGVGAIEVVALITPGSRDALSLQVGAEVTVALKATAVRIVGT